MPQALSVSLFSRIIYVDGFYLCFLGKERRPMINPESNKTQRPHHVEDAIHIIKDSKQIVPDVDKIEAVIYAMASKFLDSTELNQIKEELKMTELGLLLYNDGKADGIEQASLKDAKNLLKNGVSFEVIQASIEGLTNTDLQKIYNEVKASKENDQKTKYLEALLLLPTFVSSRGRYFVLLII